MACPVCQSDAFYIKDPADAFEIYEFKFQDGRIQFDEDDDAEASAPIMREGPEIYCQRCAWHGKISNVQ
jgi:hypothetical protein